ncbi:MAG: hypothetical protein HXY41_12545 [Chloroflexi bacterium]|nr:hypothetical protein [Chloroflexota bacterium]
MYDRPTLNELLDAVRVHLEENIIPLLKDDRKLYYQTLVAVNMLRIAGRELTMNALHMQAEWDRLNFLQGSSGTIPADDDEARQALAERNHRLCEDIAAGAYDQHPRKAALFEHLLATAVEQLQVANPHFIQVLALEDNERDRRR